MKKAQNFLKKLEKGIADIKKSEQEISSEEKNNTTKTYISRRI